MDNKTNTRKNSLLALLLFCKCPRCREGAMFKSENPWNLNNMLNMFDECSVCKQPFKLEIGFFLDYGMTSCMVTFAISMIVFFGFWITRGFPLKQTIFFIGLR